MNQSNILPRLAEIQRRNTDDYHKCRAAFAAIADAVRNHGNCGISRELKHSLLRSLDEVYVSALSHLGAAPEEVKKG